MNQCTDVTKQYTTTSLLNELDSHLENIPTVLTKILVIMLFPTALNSIWNFKLQRCSN